MAAKLVLVLWFASENELEISVLSQVNHVFVVKHNKQFNSDSQRLALSLRVEFSVYGAVVKFSVCAAHTLIGRYVLDANSCDVGACAMDKGDSEI
ncbi:hypothetical protein [Vibrio aquaticus]|uniref:hypothetical protein n=1 Tax=Vibrio aquaticus TaxID=2496559 RepID=UPI001FCA117E|nr:hypothetical protein [Vibrio aquaticus]